MKLVKSGRFRGTCGSVMKATKSELLYLDLFTYDEKTNRFKMIELLMEKD